MAFPRAEVGNRVMIKRHASCSETPRFWGSSSNYNGDTVPFPSQHTTKGSVKRMPRSAHCSTAAGASHLLYPLSLKHPACRQAEKSIPFQYLKQQHVTRFLTPECDFLAGPYLLTSNFPDFWGRTCLHPENLCHLCKNRTIWAKEKVPAMHQGEHRHVGIQQVISIHSPFRRGGRKSRENTSKKCFPNTVLSSKSHQKLKKGKKKKKWPHFIQISSPEFRLGTAFSLNKALGKSPQCAVTWNIQHQAAEDCGKTPLRDANRSGGQGRAGVTGAVRGHQPYSQLRSSPAKSLGLGYSINVKAKEMLKSGREGREGHFRKAQIKDSTSVLKKTLK